ncbi:hypothetical protein KQX54_014782 [Cotesia glomerata]|uniref:Uncharacterized protein n=1 Tax=Cotesia glomerata TaxID=32391 RepID=A0AAV7HK45_COTGL|nr:hypothetical protein KQX54_014782 [Cotesia glomerata]
MAGVPTPSKMAASHSLKRKAHADIAAPADKKSTSGPTFRSRNSFSLEDAFIAWEKNQGTEKTKFPTKHDNVDMDLEHPSDATIQTTVNEKLNNNLPQSTKTANTKSHRPPPILVQGEKVSATITALRVAGLEQEDSSISVSRGLHSIQAKNQTTYEKIKETLKANNIKFYSFTSKGEKLKSLLLKGVSEEFSTEQVLADLINKNIPAVEFIKVSELKFV